MVLIGFENNSSGTYSNVWQSAFVYQMTLIFEVVDMRQIYLCKIFTLFKYIKLFVRLKRVIHFCEQKFSSAFMVSVELIRKSQ